MILLYVLLLYENMFIQTTNHASIQTLQPAGERLHRLIGAASHFLFDTILFDLSSAHSVQLPS